MSKYTTLGPGDSATWPAYSGNPLDPRNPDDGSDDFLDLFDEFDDLHEDCDETDAS
jgi:hypothetical protein